MVSVMLSACFHISRQTIDIFLEFVRVSILKPGKFIVRKKKILIFTETAGGLSRLFLSESSLYILVLYYLWAIFAPYKVKIPALS